MSTQIDALKKDVVSLDKRMTAQEDAVKKMRAEAQDGFKHGAESMREINVSVANLAHDFGARMTNMEARIITEKEKWGEVLRTILKWGAKALILGALVAMGVNIVSSVLKSFN